MVEDVVDRLKARRWAKYGKVGLCPVQEKVEWDLEKFGANSQPITSPHTCFFWVKSEMSNVVTWFTFHKKICRNSV